MPSQPPSPAELLLPNDLACLPVLQELLSDLHAENEKLKEKVRSVTEDWYATHDELLLERYKLWEKECELYKLKAPTVHASGPKMKEEHDKGNGSGSGSGSRIAEVKIKIENDEDVKPEIMKLSPLTIRQFSSRDRGQGAEAENFMSQFNNGM
jgi:hypothetical protein